VVLLRAALDHSSPTYISCLAGITATNQHTQLVFWRGSHWAVSWAALNHNPPKLHLLSSWDYRHTPACWATMITLTVKQLNQEQWHTL
jgi:hypothetical protein